MFDRNQLFKKVEGGDLLVAISFFTAACAIILIGAGAPVLKTEKVFVSPPPHIEHFAFGYNETVADTLWIRVIQDFDICNKQQPKGVKLCQDSWVYKMLQSITDLAPYFRIAYVDGSTNLDIVVHDHYGAGKLFEKGLLRFPHYWNLEYRAAYHYIFEDQNRQKAADLLISAFKDGGPAWLPSLAGKLMTEEGKGELAIKVLTDLLDSTPDEKFHPPIEKRIQKIRDQLAQGKAVDVGE